jgi:hypothetical protein
MEPQTTVQDTKSADGDRVEAAAFRLEPIGEHRGVPIYHLIYDCPAVIDRPSQEQEVKAISAVRDPRFGLVVCFQNLSTSPDYGPAEQAEFIQSPAVQALASRLIAVARYSPGSFTTLIRAMAAHLALRRPIASGFARDLDDALDHLRAGIDIALDRAAESAKAEAAARPKQ